MSRPSIAPISTLTVHQLDYVEALCATDGTDKKIAAAMGVSTSNVRRVLLDARASLGVKTRVQLAVWAIRVGVA